MKFICPKCALPLIVSDTGAAKCKNNHSYDRSREGYYNLLLSASGGTHGDNREMLLARRRFLDTGAYEPLAREIANALSENRAKSVLDMGCGEGYYTSYIMNSLSLCDMHAYDISKEAVRLAAKRNKNISYAVASSYKVPAKDGSFDAVFNVFSPLALDEVRRILTPGGVFIMAIPDVLHLFELKAAVYDKPYKNEPESEELEGFSLIEKRLVSYTKTLSGEEVRDLFMMTPYAYRTSARERARLDEIESLELGFRFIILIYRKG